MISPGSKQVLTMLAQEWLLEPLIGSGARLLECSCGPCIGSGGAPGHLRRKRPVPSTATSRGAAAPRTPRSIWSAL